MSMTVEVSTTPAEELEGKVILKEVNV